MIIHEFLNWIEHAADGPRADGAGALGRAWLFSDLSDEDRRAATAAITVLLDDPCPDVRKALAESLGRDLRAPRHVILTLAEDIEPVAECVFRSSPLFSGAELVDAVANGSDRLQCAIAEREHLEPEVAAALAEVASGHACRLLLQNRSAKILTSSLTRIAERFSGDMGLSETLLNRGGLALPLRHRLLSRMAERLDNHPLFAEKVPDHLKSEYLADAKDKVTLHLALDASDDEMPEFADYLRAEGLLTTKLLLRAVCCGRLRFFAASLALLGNVPLDRLRHLLMSVRMSALKAVLRKAELPLRSHQAFLLSIEIAREAQANFTCDMSLSQARTLTERLLAEIQDNEFGADQDVHAFLRRFAVDVARLEARAFVKASHQKALKAA